MALMEYPPWIATAGDIQQGIDTGMQVGLGRRRLKQQHDEELVNTIQTAGQQLANTTNALLEHKQRQQAANALEAYRKGETQNAADLLQLERDKFNFQKEQNEAMNKDAASLLNELGGKPLAPVGPPSPSTTATEEAGPEGTPPVQPATTPSAAAGTEPSLTELISKYPRALKLPHVQTVLAAKAQEKIARDVQGFMQGYAKGEKPEDLLGKFPNASKDSGVHTLITQHGIAERFGQRQEGTQTRFDTREANALNEYMFKDLSGKISKAQGRLGAIDRMDLTDDEKAQQKDAIASELSDLKRQQDELAAKMRTATMQKLPVGPGTDRGDRGTVDPLGLFAPNE